MEIVTYIVQGRLTHKDSMGTEESLGRGSVQFMSAGRGVRHSEYNHEKDQGLRFIQTWIVPRRDGIVPNYGSFDPDNGEQSGESVCKAKNQWRHLVSDAQDASTDTPVKIEQDTNMYVAEMDHGESLGFELKCDRMAYVLCVEGSVKLDDGSGNKVVLERHDGCEVKPGSGDGLPDYPAHHALMDAIATAELYLAQLHGLFGSSPAQLEVLMKASQN